MSVYKPKKSSIWQYDFVYKGRRFHGSTGQTTRRTAESVERKLRHDAAEGRLGDVAQLTLDEAAGKWWAEVGQHRGDAVDTERRISVLLTLIHKETKIADITTAVVSEAVQLRRGMTFKKGKDRSRKDGTVVKAREHSLSNATVNRDVIQTLRPILRRARRIWGAKGLPDIAWGDLSLPVPRETVRVYSNEEQEAWLSENEGAAALALRLLLRYGLRFGELFFHPRQFEADGARLSMMKGRKLDVPHTLPILEEDAREIAARASRALASGLESIWYDEFVDDDGNIRLSPITYYGLQARLRSSSKRARITQGRVIHGTRHHAGTTIQRATGNMKITQRLLGHLDPKSTHRYVHAMDDEVRHALENVELSRHSPEAPAAEDKKSISGK